MEKSLSEIIAERAAAAERQKADAHASQNGHGPTPAPHHEREADEPLPEERPAAAERSTWSNPGRQQREEALKRPPNSAEAEQGILGSMLLEPRFAVPIALQGVSTEFFYTPSHQLVFQKLCEVWADQGCLDLISFTQILRDQNILESVGGAAFISNLYTFVPTAANVSYYIEIVKEKFDLRQLIATNTEYIRRANDEQSDVGELLREFGEHAERVVKSAISGGSRLPALRDLSLMLDVNLPPKPPELVKGVLHQGSKIIVGGTSKGRKTFALMDLAISVATGQPWWGFETVQGPVCYINFEIQEPFFAQRTQDICRAKGAAAGGPPLQIPAGMLHAWNLRGHGEGIENLVEELLFVLRLRDWALIIFDPIYKALGNRDENKAGDVASMLNELEKIAVRTGAAIGFGAHYSKGNQAAKESIDRIGGSGVFARDPDAILTMTAHEEEEAFTVDATLRNFSPLKPFVIQWDWPLFTRAEDLDPDELKQPRKPNSGQFSGQFSKDSIIEELSVIEGIRPAALLKRVGDQTGMSRSHFYKLAKGLKDAGKLTEKEGLWFRSSVSESA